MTAFYVLLDLMDKMPVKGMAVDPWSVEISQNLAGKL